MEKVNVYVWNDFDKDDRVKKKVDTLSKEFEVEVFSVCKQKKPNKVVKYKDNVIINYYWFNSFIEWLFNRSINNYKFWKNKIKPCSIVDCNDPDTLRAGVITKRKYNNIKIVYDSHEIWSGTRRKENNLLYTMYAYVFNTYHYMSEKRFIKYIDQGVCVSNEIKDILQVRYNKPFSVILNTTNYFDYKGLKKSEEVVFFGSRARVGINNIARNFKSVGISPVYIGSGKIDGNIWNNKGFMNKEEYNKEITKAKYGMCILNVNCDNFKYSMPNKLFQYIMCGCPVITIKDMVSTSSFVKENHIGVVLDNASNDNVKEGIKKLKKGFYKFNNNMNKIKKVYCWEAQEDKLIKLYKKV